MKSCKSGLVSDSSSDPSSVVLETHHVLGLCEELLTKLDDRIDSKLDSLKNVFR